MEKTIRPFSALALSLAVLLGLFPINTSAVRDRIEETAQIASAFLSEAAPVFQSGRSYGGRQTDVFQNVINTNDGGFLVSAYSMGASEDPAWSHVGIASNNDALLLKFDANGGLQWHKAYQTEGVEVFTSIAELSDGRFAAVGRQSFTAGPEGSESMKGVCWYLLLIDPENPEHYTDYHIGGAKGDQGYGVSATPDGGFVVSGWSASDTGYYSYSTDQVNYTEPVQLWEAQDGTDDAIPNRVASSGSDSVVVKFDSSGNVVFTALHNYGVSEDFYTVSTPTERMAAMAVDRKGDIFLAGTNAVAKNVTNGFVAKLSGADGSLLWHRSVGSSSKEEPADAAGKIKIEFRAMDILADDSVVISGTSTNNATTEEAWTVTSEDDILVLRYAGADGAFLFAESIGTVSGTGRPEGVTATEDGGWMVCGSMNKSIVEPALTGKGYVWDNYGGQDALLIQYSADNSVVWAGNYGSRNGDWFNDAAVLKNGEIVVVGESNGQYGTPAYSNHGGIDGILVCTGVHEGIYTEPVNAAADGNVEWADGTYTAAGDGFGGENSVEVTVVITGGGIDSVTGESRGDTTAFYSQAAALHNTIKEQQTADVDGVSGATYSSNGIKEAASRALGQAAAAWVDGLIDAIAGKSSDNAKKTAAQTAANAYTELGTYSAGLLQNRAVLEAACETYGIDLIARTDFVTPDVTPESDDGILRHNDTYYSQQYEYYKNIHTEAFEDAELTGEGVVIAVIDSGLTASHTDLDYSRVLDGYDYDSGTEMPKDALTDNNGHGTAVAGILTAISDNGIGVAGLLSGVQIVPLKVTPVDPDKEGAEESSAQVAQAIRDAVDRFGADVITTSLSVKDTEALREAVAYAAGKNVIVTGAAGNSSTSEADPYLYPASYDEVVSVGAVDAKNVVRASSQKNDQVFATAPGEGIVVLDLSLSGRCKIANGTSYASPLVAAMAAAAKQHDKEITVEQFKELLKSSCTDAGTEGYDTSYGWGVVDFAAFASALQGETDEPAYVLMNIPYRDFYAAEVNAPNAANAADIDAWTSATKSKPLSGTLAAGSYHVNSDGSDISGVIYPVQVTDLSVLDGKTRVTDETSVTITTTLRGTTSTTEYKGKDALFESPDYSYYVLSEASALYKVLTVEAGGAFSFGPVNAAPETVSGVTTVVNYETHHHNDAEVVLNGVELPDGAIVSGVIATDSDGNQYPLRHMEGIWRQTQIGWPDTAAAGIGGKTVTNVRFILRDSVMDCPVSFTVKPKLDAALTVEFTGTREITFSGLTDAMQNAKATVTYTTGERPNTETHIVAENAAVTDGKVTLTEDAIDGTAYTVKVVCDNYGDKSASVTYTAAETSEPGTDEPAYVLMNIPYRDFYAAEVNSTAPNGADAANIDAWTSATKSKPLSGSLAAGSYHVNSDGSDISGVIYPVQVSDLSVLNGQTRVRDETSVTITTTLRGTTSTTDYKGKDALFESASYSYYVLSEAPALYKVLTVGADGAFSFGPINATPTSVSGVTAVVNYETHHHNDAEVVLNGVALSDGAIVSGVIATDSDGNQYPLRHMEGIWRQTQIGWPDTAAAGIGGKTITNVRFILQDSVLDCPVSFTVKAKLDAELTAEFNGAREMTISGLSDTMQNAKATVTYTTGERPNTQTHTVVENAVVTDGKVTLTEDAIDGTAYTVKVVCDNYGDKSATVTYTAADTPDDPGPDTPDPTPTPSKRGCYVATSVYGSYDCPQVWTLRRYRDEVLGETWYGRLFIRLYYAVTPTAVRLFGDTDLFQNFFRSRLDQMVSQLQEDGFASTPYQDKDW